MVLKFSSILLDEDEIDLNFSLFGSILKYFIEFKIPYKTNEKIHIIDSSSGKIVEDSNQIIINWEYYAANIINWNLQWIKFNLPTADDVNCDYNAEVVLTNKKAKIDVKYTLEFPGFAIEKIKIFLDSDTIIISSNKGTIQSLTNKAIIKLDSLTYDRLEIRLVFETKFSFSKKAFGFFV